MKIAADFREAARQALSGKWLTAVLTAFVASLLGVSSVTLSYSSGTNINSSTETQLGNVQITDFWLQYRFIIISAIVISLLWLIAIIVVSGAVRLGYAKYNLKLVDKEDARVSELFSQFDRLGDGFCMNFFISLFTGLWSLLFVIPGIIKSLSYSMTPYILAEHPELTARQAITKSRYLMDGNKWRLFCLGFSFIGWILLCSLPIIAGASIAGAVYAFSGSFSAFLWVLPFYLVCLVASLFLCAYREAAFADFYRSISGSAKVDDGNITE